MKFRPLFWLVVASVLNGTFAQGAPRDIEGALGFHALEECEVARSVLVTSGVEGLNATTFCVTSAIGPTFYFRIKDTGTIDQSFPGSQSLGTEECRTIARALYSSVINSSGPDYLTAKCEEIPNQNGKARLIAYLDHYSRTESVVGLRSIESCESARSTLVDSGLGPDLDPRGCYQGGLGPQLRLFVVNPRVPHKFEASNVVPRSRCLEALDVLSMLMVIYPGDEHAVVSGSCLSEPNSSDAKLVLIVDPLSAGSAVHPRVSDSFKKVSPQIGENLTPLSNQSSRLE